MISLRQAVPGKTDYLLYGWVVQLGAGISLQIAIFPNARLFTWSLFFITLTSSASVLGQFMGQLWEFIGDRTSLSSRELSLIWAGQIISSMITGALFMPWYNVTNEERSGKTLISIIRAQEPLIQRPTNSLFDNFKTTLRCLYSPVFLTSMIIFSVCNLVTFLTLSLINDFIYDRKDQIENSGSTYEGYLSHFNVTKTVIATSASPILGLILQYMRDKYNQEKYDSRLVQLVWPYLLFAFALFLMAIGVFQNSVGSLWLVIISFSVTMRLGYFYYLLRG